MNPPIGRYCLKHQGNGSHYAPHNCRVCHLEAALAIMAKSRDNWELASRVTNARLDKLQAGLLLGAASIVEVANGVAEHGDIRRAIDESPTLRT